MKFIICADTGSLPLWGSADRLTACWNKNHAIMQSSLRQLKYLHCCRLFRIIQISLKITVIFNPAALRLPAKHTVFTAALNGGDALHYTLAVPVPDSDLHTSA